MLLLERAVGEVESRVGIERESLSGRAIGFGEMPRPFRVSADSIRERAVGEVERRVMPGLGTEDKISCILAGLSLAPVARTEYENPSFILAGY